MARTCEFVDDYLLRVGSVEFHCVVPITHMPGRLPVAKRRPLVEDYIDMCGTLAPRRIVELGINQGGSTALLNELAGPEKLVAIELSDDPLPLLERYVEERGLASTIRPYLGVDQSDRVRLAEISRTEFAGQQLDLVVDDASHLYEQSRASFEVLFPLVRPGGLYILEDWSCQHLIANAMRAAGDDLPELARREIAQRITRIEDGSALPQLPLSRLVLELVLARASSAGAIESLTIGSDWVSVRRGPDDLDTESFRIADIVNDDYCELRSHPSMI